MHGPGIRDLFWRQKVDWLTHSLSSWTFVAFGKTILVVDANADLFGSSTQEVRGG